MMSMMDEAEKQISYEENYEIIIKLNNYILPFALIGIFLIGTFFPVSYTHLVSWTM